MFEHVAISNMVSSLMAMADTGAFAGERLYNGIELPEQWPPNYDELTREPMVAPYLDSPPEVIRIDVGRQLFVDDFLIQSTTLDRTFHRPKMYPENPIFRAAPYSGGVWYDSQDSTFKMWYNLRGGVGYATSKDGIHWEKPSLDVSEGTNVVINHTTILEPKSPVRCDTTCVWIDYSDSDPGRRYKCFVTYEWPNNTNDFFLSLLYSPDGIHWTGPVATGWRLVGDHTNAHYNPFRNVWVANIRYTWRGNRSRAYMEHPDPATLTEQAKSAIEDEVVHWIGADRLDPHNPRPIHAHISPQLYHFDAIAYESVMLGFFTVHQGPTNEECHRLGIPKRNEVLLGYSRDGYHFHRPDRRPFIGVREEDNAWNWGNVQSASGNCLVVGDQLYFYCNGTGRGENSGRNAGLAILRRDGFASMNSIKDEGRLTTRLVQFNGKYLFLNTNCEQGKLHVEALDKDGKVIAPFSKENCVPISVDETLQAVSWEGAEDISELAGKPVRFRFHLRLGQLYSFWVSPDESGASHGCVGAGGPGYTGVKDTVGKKAYR